DAEKIRALAARLHHEVEAEGVRLMNEAQNILTIEARSSAARLKLIDKLDAIIREQVKPMERIEGIKILHVDGLGGGPGRAGPDGGGNFADSIVNSALRYRAQAPLVDSLLKEIGLSGADLGKLGKLMREPAESDDELK
ncbi:MAG TPA: flotillin domain-containing protein, partial [Dongiaceae bacterium]|nr:flotillin domain-containing protein [Dongiaceae bacterium]